MGCGVHGKVVMDLYKTFKCNNERLTKMLSRIHQGGENVRIILYTNVQGDIDFNINRYH